MRRYLVLLFALLFIPLKVYAGCSPTFYKVWPHEAAQDGGWLYYLNDAIPTFCVDPDYLDPDHVNYVCTPDMSKADERGYVGIYRMYLTHGKAYYPARKAMRALTQRIMGTGLGLSFDISTAGKYYCGGACAAGISDCNTPACQNHLSGINTKWLSAKFGDFTIQMKETGKDFEHTEGIFTFEAYGNGYDNILAITDPKTGFGTDLSASLTITGCSVSDSRFSCSLIDGGKDLLKNNLQQVKLSTNSVISSSTEVSVNIRYKLDFPFAAASDGLVVYGCIGMDCSVTAARPDTIGWPTQRLLVIQDVPEQNVNVNIRTVIPPACRTSGSGAGKKYYLGYREVTLVDYLKAGCCKDVDVADVEQSNPAIDAYRDACLKDDKVKFELECGTKSKVNTTINKIGTESYDSNICTNEAYSDYTHSYVWQMGVNRVLRQLEIKEKGAYMYNLDGIYGDNIADYTDTSYMYSSLVGKDGNSLAPVSSGNKYCMLLISEVDDMYFPGTTIATSGRFFVFNELNKQECVNSEEPGANCFRQPYVMGRINVAFHTNFDKWDRDYQNAIDAEKAASGGSYYEMVAASDARRTLEEYKTECEARRNIANYWDYNLNPKLDFGFKQKIYGGKEISDMIDEKVEMEISTEGVRYWPRASTDPKKTGSSGSQNMKTYTLADGSTKSWDSTVNYFADFERTVYYRPKKATYATLASNQYKLVDESFQTEAQLMENGLRVGYVYNVQLTAYEGTYSTYFYPSNMGHTSKNGQNNVQPILNQYAAEIGKQLSSECFYCNDYGEFDRVCETCPDPTPELQPVYIYRSISLSDVTPNIRENTNWSDAKGLAAKALIQASAGEKISERTANDEEEKLLEKYQPVILGESSDSSEITVENLRGKDIYNDETEEFLEYEIELSVEDMMIIRANNKREDFSFDGFTKCNSISAANIAKSATANYCFTCNKDGKECESTFIDAFGKTSVTTVTRTSKWKYFIDGKWLTGSMKTIKDFKNGRYPDPTNQEKWLETHLNWP